MPYLENIGGTLNHAKEKCCSPYGQRVEEQNEKPFFYCTLLQGSRLIWRKEQTETKWMKNCEFENPFETQVLLHVMDIAYLVLIHEFAQEDLQKCSDSHIYSGPFKKSHHYTDDRLRVRQRGVEIHIPTFHYFSLKIPGSRDSWERA